MSYFNGQDAATAAAAAAAAMGGSGHGGIPQVPQIVKQENHGGNGIVGQIGVGLPRKRRLDNPMQGVTQFVGNGQQNVTSPGGTGGTIKGPCYIKVLVPDRLAGLIIGKGGSGIADMEAQTGASIRLSGSRVYFPGTSERVMVCGGEAISIESIVPLVLSKLNESETQAMARLVLPNSAVSCIIGKGGEVIKTISAQSGANIRAGDRIDNTAQERIVDVKGSLSAVNAACQEIARRIQGDGTFRENACVLTYSPQMPLGSFDPTGGRGGNVHGGVPQASVTALHHDSSYYYPPNSGNAAMAAAANQSGILPNRGAMSMGAPQQLPGGLSPAIESYQLSLEFNVPSVAVGAIIGKGGEVRTRIVHQTGANVVVSERTADQTADRKITIAGPLAAVQAALVMVVRQIVESQ